MTDRWDEARCDLVGWARVGAIRFEWLPGRLERLEATLPTQTRFFGPLPDDESNFYGVVVSAERIWLVTIDEASSRGR